MRGFESLSARVIVGEIFGVHCFVPRIRVAKPGYFVRGERGMPDAFDFVIEPAAGASKIGVKSYVH